MLPRETKAVALVNGGHLQKFQKGKKLQHCVAQQDVRRYLTNKTHIAAFICFRWRLFALQSCGGVLVMFSETHWRSVQVAWLSSPAGIFLLPFPLLHRCLLAYMSCHMFPARPPPEGAKSVFVHNLHRLTRPTLTH